jgi:hypothetical protein
MPFALSIDGCPSFFGTAGAEFGSTADDDNPFDSVFRPGVLDVPRGTIRERMKPLDGDLDVSGMTFRLIDVEVEEDEYYLISRLGTLNASNNPSTEITSDIEDVSTSFTVADGSAFASSGYCFIGQEAIEFTRSGNTFTIVGRGRYGSRMVPHRRDTSNSFAPSVFKFFPGFERRRVVLWQIGEAPTFTPRPIWRGYCMRAPRLAADGASYELQCESAWSVEREMRLGIPTARVRMRGFDWKQIVAYLTPTAPPDTGHSPYTSGTSIYRFHRTVETNIRDDLQDALLFVGSQFRANLEGDTSTPPAAYRDQLSFSLKLMAGGMVEWEATTGNVDFMLQLKLGGIIHDAQSTEQSNGSRYAIVSVPAPDALLSYDVSHNNGRVTIPVNTIAGLPASFSSDTFDETDGLHTTTIGLTLRTGPDSAGGKQLLVQPTSITSNPPRINGIGRVIIIDPNVQYTYEGFDVASVISFSGSTQLLLTTTIDTTHWIYGLQHGLFSEHVGEAGDLRNWNWSLARSIVEATDSGNSRRSWTFDGETKAGEFIMGLAALNGCGVGVRASRYAIVPFRGTLATDAAVVSITPNDFVPGTKPTWSTFPDGLANVVDLQAGNVRLVVKDQASISRFGQARTIKLTVSGGNDGIFAGATPSQIMSEVLSRVLGLWSRPTALARVTVPATEFMHSVYLGDTVQITSKFLPAGDGSRDVTSRPMQVIGRELDLANGALTLEGVIYDLGNVSGYAPALKVASRIGDDTIVAARSYLTASNTLSDYSGNLGASSDGGVSKFAPGDQVYLIRRDVTTLETDVLEVESISPATSGSSTVTFTTNISPGFRTHIDNGEWIDLVYAEYDTTGVLPAQKQYAYVGSHTTGKIGSSSDAAKVWSP